MALMTDLLGRLKARIPADTQYPFLDPDLQQLITDAINQHNPQYSVDSLPEPDEYLIIWLALITVYLILATKYAEDFAVKASGDDYALDQPHIHYMDLADKLQKQYLLMADPTIQVATATRVDLRTGRKTGLFPGDVQ